MGRPAAELPVIATDLPVLYEDEGQEEMGDSRPHTTTEGVLYYALLAHFAARPGHEVLADMNLYYHPVRKWAYVSPDLMVVVPPAPLPADLKSYRVGTTGPAPVLAVEVLSQRTFQQGNLTLKPDIYAELGVREYLLVDVTGLYLPERLLLKTLDGDQWFNSPDEGDGVVSRFGFRVTVEPDGEAGVSDLTSGRRYPRPDEADALARRVQELEAELARLRGQSPPG